MVKLYTSLLALTLTTSLALAAPYPSYNHGHDYYDRDLLDRDLDEEFSRSEYLDASDDLDAREPSFFGGIGHIFKDVGNVVKKGVHVAEDVAENPIVQVAASFIPGEAEVAAAGKVVGALGKLGKVGKAVKAVERAKKASGKVKNAIKTARKVQKVAKQVTPSNSGHNSNSKQKSSRRHHRRDLDSEDYEELLARRDLDAEELFGRNGRAGTFQVQ